MNFVIQPAINWLWVFSTENIPSWSLLFPLSWNIVTIEMLEDEWVFTQKSANAYRFDIDTYLCCNDQFGNFINHSCNPNACILKICDTLVVYACRYIYKNDEIVIDYSTTMARDDWWGMVCNCRESVCRWYIWNILTLDQILRDNYNYLWMFPPYILSI